MKQSIACWITLTSCLVVGSAATGCGDDSMADSVTGGSGGTTGTGGSAGKAGAAGSSGSAGTAGSGSAGTAGSGGSAGKAGAAGSGAAGGTADSGADSGPMTMQCGTKTCPAVDLGAPIGTLAACCAPGEMNACGLVLQGICFTTTPGTSHPTCTDVTLPTTTGMMVTVPGCCTVRGVCGGDLGTPLGCNELTPFTGQSGAPCSGDGGQPPPPDSGVDSGTSPDAASDASDAGDATDGAPNSDASQDGASDVRPSDARTDGPG
jgi:hypothetical protein